MTSKLTTNVVISEIPDVFLFNTTEEGDYIIRYKDDENLYQVISFNPDNYSRDAAPVKAQEAVRLLMDYING